MCLEPELQPGSNREAFVSRGRQSPCDQTRHSLFGERARGPPGRLEGQKREGEKGTLVDMVDSPPPPPLPLFLQREKCHSRRRGNGLFIDLLSHLSLQHIDRLQRMDGCVQRQVDCFIVPSFCCSSKEELDGIKRKMLSKPYWDIQCFHGNFNPWLSDISSITLKNFSLLILAVIRDVVW